MKNIIILGASGFVGRELINICINHPDISIVGLSANDSIGEKIDFNSLNKGSSLDSLPILPSPENPPSISL